MGLRFVLPTFTENKKTNKQPSLSLNTDSLQLASNTESLPLTVAESNVAFEARRERHLHPKALSMHPGGLIQLMGVLCFHSSSRDYTVRFAARPILCL